MRAIGKIMSVLCAAILMIGCLTMTVLAGDSNVTYSGNSGKFIFEPGSEYSPTDLFDNFKNVMPGDSLTQKIEVKNKADDKVDVKIYLRSLGSTDPVFNDFLNQLRLTVSKTGEAPMFDAEADKTDGLTDWVCLGTLKSGGSVVLNVTLDVPVTMDNMFQQQIGKIKWQFMAEEYPVDTPDPTKTGDDSHIGMWVTIGICAVILILVVLLRRRCEDKEERAKC